MNQEVQKTITKSIFRISEFRGIFEIQRKVIEKSGILWWKRTEEYWTSIDIFGTPLYHYRFISNCNMINPTYKTLEEANEALTEIINGKIYHTL